MLKNRLFFIFIFISVIDGVSQVNYKVADSIALNVSNKRHSSVEQLTKSLTSSFSNDKMKFRSIYKWITLNITYKANSNIYSPKKVIRQKEVNCKGYSYLLKEMCEFADIECVIVDGWVKTRLDHNSKSTWPEHLWNEVKLNGEWYPTDVTWGSSKRKLDGSHTHEFDESYFLMKPDLFYLKHLPRKRKATTSKISRIEFGNFPIYLPNYFDYESMFSFTKKIKFNNHFKELRIVLTEKGKHLKKEIYIEVWRTYDKIVKPRIGESENELIFDLSFVKKKSRSVIKVNDKILIGFYLC